jgi:crossover junction endodeoxyribonuclease RuvC
MIVLGIDPGFGRIGTAIIHKGAGSEKLIFSDCIETDKNLDFAERLNVITEIITGIITKHQPDVIAIEKLFFTSNQKTAMRVAEVRGAIISTANLKKLPVAEYTPLEIKVAVTGYGKSNKAQVANMVRRLIKLDKLPRYDDEYDAIACALTHLASVKHN